MDKEYDPEQGLPSVESEERKDTGNVIGGYKATLSNDGTSDEAKKHAQEKLDEIEENKNMA